MSEEMNYQDLEFTENLIEELENEFSSFIGEEFENIRQENIFYLD